ADHNRSKEVVEVFPSKVIIVEGILIFADERLRNMFDIKLYIDTDADVRILRRVLRDVKERGRSLDSIVNQYLTTVKPMHEQFIEPSKKYADVIIPEGGHNQVALAMVNHRIHSLLDAEE
ncbi:MAG: uridine kinase, partial [Clostridia bacterium]|nr:uridine kinase [Clostridia bacterium]